jgi:hypothetical protein
MCYGNTTFKVPYQAPPDVSTWTPEQINEFLVKYPTKQKADAVPYPNGPGSIWDSVAGSTQGRSFLAIHAQNRRAAGDTAEADAITSYLQSSDPTKITRLPTLPTPLTSVSNAASSVTRADIPLLNQTIATNRTGSNDLVIPLQSKPDSLHIPT